MIFGFIEIESILKTSIDLFVLLSKILSSETIEKAIVKLGG